nr:immunoglobulin heavy chain junction region [Mus musculus]
CARGEVGHFLPFAYW